MELSIALGVSIHSADIGNLGTLQMQARVIYSCNIARVIYSCNIARVI